MAYYILFPIMLEHACVLSVSPLDGFTRQQFHIAVSRLISGALVHKRMGLPASFGDLMNSPSFRTENPTNAQIVDIMIQNRIHPDVLGPANAYTAHLPAMYINQEGACVATGYLRAVLRGHDDLYLLT